MVAWLSHAGTLIRAAPERLRMATSLESRTYDMLSDSGLLSPQNMTGTRYVDLGAIPSPSEERNASHMQTDDPHLKHMDNHHNHQADRLLDRLNDHAKNPREK